MYGSKLTVSGYLSQTWNATACCRASSSILNPNLDPHTPCDPVCVQAAACCRASKSGRPQRLPSPAATVMRKPSPLPLFRAGRTSPLLPPLPRLPLRPGTEVGPHLPKWAQTGTECDLRDKCVSCSCCKEMVALGSLCYSPHSQAAHRPFGLYAYNRLLQDDLTACVLAARH